MTPGSPSGIAYDSLARRTRRRREEIRALLDSGLSLDAVVARYNRDHPLERVLTPEEVRSTARR